MAKKPAAASVPADEMDYPQHEATYELFLGMVKWGIVSMVFVVLALYSFIEAQQPILGVVLLLAIPVVIIAATAMKTRRS